MCVALYATSHNYVILSDSEGSPDDPDASRSIAQISDSSLRFATLRMTNYTFSNFSNQLRKLLQSTAGIHSPWGVTVGTSAARYNCPSGVLIIPWASIIR